MKLILSMFMLSMLMFGACEEAVSPDAFTHKYEQSKCSDPWGNDRDVDAFTQAVVQYLKNKLITVLDTKVETSTGQSCEACHCTTGTILMIKVSEEDGEKLLDLDE
ncbi:MAG: hypothetical protein AAF696_11525, partial [Bacteroidota bacterium]